MVLSRAVNQLTGFKTNYSLKIRNSSNQNRNFFPKMMRICKELICTFPFIEIPVHIAVNSNFCLNKSNWINQLTGFFLVSGYARNQTFYQQESVFLHPGGMRIGQWPILIPPGCRNTDSCWQKFQFSTQTG